MRMTVLLVAIFWIGPLWAMPIATEVALPVARDQGIVRIKSTVNSESQTTTNLFALGYGLHADTTLIVMLPYMHSSETSGLSDVPILMRQTLIKSDGHLRTLRLAALGGIEIPTWRDSISQKNVGLRAGSVFTFQSNRHEVDADLIYSHKIPSGDFNKGNALAYDLAYQFRFYPWALAEEGASSQWNLDFELNGAYEARDKLGGSEVAATGGQHLYFSSGIQWVTTSIVLEALYQIPIVNQLNGDRSLGHQFIVSFRSLVF